MKVTDLINMQNEFISLSTEFLNSNEDNFQANLSGLKNFCISTQIIKDILDPISKIDFDGLEYVAKKSNPQYKFHKFPKPTTRNDLLKISYDLLSDNSFKANRVINYALWALHPGTNNIDELLNIGTQELFQKFINYINLKLTKQINNTKKDIPPSQLNFNIENASGSIIGTQQTATINNGLSFDEVEKYIHDKKDIDSSDKEQLLELTNYLKILTKNNTPMCKGTLAKFSDLIAKHSWCFSLIGNALTKYFLG